MLGSAGVSVSSLDRRGMVSGYGLCLRLRHVWDCLLVGWLLAERPSNMLVYLRDGSAQTILRAATLR